MTFIAFLTWIAAALVGMYLLAVWLIEYDPEFQRAAATRLPIPILVSHVLLAVTGLIVWGVYLFVDSRRLAVTAAAILVAVAGLGATMAWRWVGVYRAHPARSGPEINDVQGTIPPERNFPLPAVIGHGVLAVTTFLLVVLTALRVVGG